MTETLLPDDTAPEPEAPAPEAEASAEDLVRFRRAIGVPETADGYEIAVPETLGGADAELNRRLHEAGFSNAQTQLVYDLAQEYLTPILADAASEFEAERQTERLVREFGGETEWRAAARQLLAWGRKNLQPEVLDALGSTYEGVMALRRMAASGEPGLLRNGGGGGLGSEEDVRSLMRDPRYWRDRDPAVVAQVTSAFERLYGNG